MKFRIVRGKGGQELTTSGFLFPFPPSPWKLSFAWIKVKFHILEDRNSWTAFLLLLGFFDLFCFNFLAAPHCMWDLSSPTRNWTHPLAVRYLQETVKDREAWCAAVLGVAKCWTWLSNWTALQWKHSLNYWANRGVPTLLWNRGMEMEMGAEQKTWGVSPFGKSHSFLELHVCHFTESSW